MLNNLGAKKKLTKVAIFSLRLVLGQLLVLYLPWLVVLNNSMRLEDILYRFILNFATALPFLQVCSYEALESADSLAEAALTA